MPPYPSNFWGNVLPQNQGPGGVPQAIEKVTVVHVTEGEVNDENDSNDH